MIGFLIPLVLRAGVPERIAKPVAKVVLVVAAVAALIVGFMLWDHFDDKAAVEADRNASKAEAVSTARHADERAEAAATGKEKDIQDGNERAREAAGGSDDPLGDGLRSLRTEADRGR